MKKKAVLVYLSESDHNDLKRRAETSGRTMTAIVRDALRLERAEDKKRRSILRRNGVASA